MTLVVRSAVTGSVVRTLIGSSQRLLFPWLAFTIKGLEQGWLAQCQFKSDWVGYNVYQQHGTVKPGLRLDPHTPSELSTH